MNATPAPSGAPFPGPLVDFEHTVDAWVQRERRGLWNMATDFAGSFAGALFLQMVGSDYTHWTRPLVVSALSASFWTAFAQILPKVPRSEISAIVQEVRSRHPS